MNTNISAYPCAWPIDQKRTPPGARERGTFKITPDKARRELLHEIDKLVLGKEARTMTLYREEIIISSNVPVRQDGEPIAGRKPASDPAVAVYFERNGKRVCFACDKYDQPWKNMHAIRLTIEAMRGIERWGGRELMNRTFTGFEALPGKRGPDCWEQLGLGQPELGIEKHVAERIIVEAWKEKAKTAHPDMEGGSHEAFAALNEAKEIALATIRAR